jgi:hypothetical protein
VLQLVSYEGGNGPGASIGIHMDDLRTNDVAGLIGTNDVAGLIGVGTAAGGLPPAQLVADLV